MKPKLRQSSMSPLFNLCGLYESHINRLEWLAYIGQPMLYDGELFVLRRELEPGLDTLLWYRTARQV